MPRRPRQDAPGAFQHVLVRGIERRAIFHDDRDREDFLERLARQIEDGAGTCLAWALMPNHVHLMLRTGALPLSRLMARLETGYAVRFNLRHDRCGHLFQNRFKSILIRSDAQLRLTLRYVHRNPLEAGLVSSPSTLATYPWTGHATLMGEVPRDFQSVEPVLGWFGRTLASARRGLARWMDECEPAAVDASTGAEGEAGEAGPISEVSMPGRHGPLCWSVDEVVSWVCTQLAASEAAVRSGRRDAASSQARAIAIHLATRELGASGAEIARAVGISPGCVSRSVERGGTLAHAARLTLHPRGPRKGNQGNERPPPTCRSLRRRG